MQAGTPIDWYIQRFIIQLMPYAVAAIGVTLISVTPLGRAAISWLKGHINRGRAAELASELEQVRIELGEVQERLDFTERHLLNPSSPSAPPPAKPRAQTDAASRPRTPV
jgi:hypothetical protein